MKVHLLTCMAGDTFLHVAGDILEISDLEGQRLIECGVAIGIAESAPELENPEAKISSRRSRR